MEYTTISFYSIDCGDWHSHPYGSVERSKTDEDTFAKIRPEIDGIGVCLITNGNNHKAYILD